MVPTLTWGLERSNFALDMVKNPQLLLFSRCVE